MVPATSAAQDPASQKNAQKDRKTASSLTGCVDQKEGLFVLVDDRGLETVASLEADGFPTESFAKHVGHKVTVRGKSRTEGARLVFQVRSIETLSDTCAPSPQPE